MSLKLWDVLFVVWIMLGVSLGILNAYLAFFPINIDPVYHGLCSAACFLSAFVLVVNRLNRK